MTGKRLLPIGRQTFEVLIRNQALYVDKTQYVYELITTGSVYFLARPRRFGKSLLATTFEALFQGKKELFEGLWISGNTDYEFPEYPVIFFDLSKKRVKNPRDFEEFIINEINEYAHSHGISLSLTEYDERFSELIRKLHAKHNSQIVVLIDEYDKPIIDNIANPNVLDIRDTVRQFYTVLKAADRHLHFVFLTGVSKFSKVSVFSGLNNLLDVSMDPKYAAICGYTQVELETCFRLWIADLAAQRGEDENDILKKINYWYNGYRFSIGEQRVYNPFSTLLFFQQQIFKSFWFETGTPTMLINLLQENNFELKKLEGFSLREENFSSFEVDDLKIEALLFQTGYLTILNYHEEDEEFVLGYPNYEVRKSFLNQLLSKTLGKFRPNGAIDIQLIKCIRNGDIEGFLETLQSFFAGIPYDIQPGKRQREKEKYYQSIFYVIFALLGLHVRVEERTNKGRIDAVVETKNRIYLFEFKMDAADPEKAIDGALKQIKQNSYFEKYLKDTGRKSLTLIGVGFAVEGRGIAGWKIEDWLLG